MTLTLGKWDMRGDGLVGGAGWSLNMELLILLLVCAIDIDLWNCSDINRIHENWFESLVKNLVLDRLSIDDLGCITWFLDAEKFRS